MTDTARYLGPTLDATLNRLSARERRYVRTALAAPTPRARLLGGRIYTVRYNRPVTGVETDPPEET